MNFNNINKITDLQFNKKQITFCFDNGSSYIIEQDIQISIPEIKIKGFAQIELTDRSLTLIIGPPISIIGRNTKYIIIIGNGWDDKEKKNDFLNDLMGIKNTKFREWIIKKRALSFNINNYNKDSKKLFEEILKKIRNAGFMNSIAKRKNKKGLLPIHIAIECNKSPYIIKALIKAFPESLKLKDENGDTPIMIALFFNSSKEIIEVLINASSESLLEKDKDGNTPLMLALMLNYDPVENNNVPISDNIIELLIEKEPKAAEIQNNELEIPLHYAMLLNNINIIKVLIGIYPAGLNVIDSQGDTPIKCAKNQDITFSNEINKFISNYQNKELQNASSVNASSLNASLSQNIEHKNAIIIDFCKTIIENTGLEILTSQMYLYMIIMQYMIMNISEQKIPLDFKYIESILDDRKFNESICFIIMRVSLLYVLDTNITNNIINNFSEKYLNTALTEILMAKKFLKLWITKVKSELNNNKSKLNNNNEILYKYKTEEYLTKFSDNINKNINMNTKNIYELKNKNNNLQKLQITKEFMNTICENQPKLFDQLINKSISDYIQYKRP